MKPLKEAAQARRNGWCGLGGMAALCAALAAPQAHAVDVDAGDYTALPAGTNLAMAYYQYATRDAAYVRGRKQAGDPRLDSHVGILRGVHFTEIGGYIVDPQFLLPFGKLEGKDDLSAAGSASGVGDLILAATVWLVNKPQTGTYFGITPFLYAPTGNYDNDDALNLGENRWKFALQAGFITKLSEKVSLDLIGDFTLYGKNDKFGAAKVTMKQKPSMQFQGYLRYHLSDAWDLRAGVSHTVGGETEVAGVDQGDRLRTTKVSVGTGWFIAPDLQLLASYGRDVSVRNGLREDDRLNLRVLKVF
ncbi:transporter [Thauera linaloolentis]|nr:transporter [Thauera linaloolentis]MCM8567478.1 transporter [Thauera linaloolentis]